MIQHLHHLRRFAAPAALLGTCILLAGCANVPPATQTVYVPVHTPCVRNQPAAPAYEFDKLQLESPDGDKILALARDWLRARKYEGEMAAALAGCP